MVTSCSDAPARQLKVLQASPRLSSTSGTVHLLTQPHTFDRQAAGTLISRDRDMSKALMTSIVLKSDVTLMDIVSTRMLGQFGFLAKIFNIFKDQQISVDVVATSEIAVLPHP